MYIIILCVYCVNMYAYIHCVYNNYVCDWVASITLAKAGFSFCSCVCRILFPNTSLESKIIVIGHV